MTNIEKFKTEFATQVAQYERCTGASLANSGKESRPYHLISAMLNWTFGFTKTQIEKLVWGKRFSYTYQKQRRHYRLGGITAQYSGSAVWTVFDSICFYLETGWWPMGLDKASLNPASLETYTQPKDKFDRRLKVFYHATENFVVACSGDDGQPNWWYTAVMIKPEYIMAFVDGFDSPMQFDGVDFDCETGDFIGSGYSAVDLKQLAWKLHFKG